MGRHPAPRALPASGEALDDRSRLCRVDGGAGDRGSGNSIEFVRPVGDSRLMRSDRFELAAYKGARLSFRPWDGQLRQPVLLADARSLVSVSPQPGFLHQFSELDTLGIDRPETKCRMH